MHAVRRHCQRPGHQPPGEDALDAAHDQVARSKPRISRSAGRAGRSSTSVRRETVAR
jgi:hypothetical protein